mmetsp:Transcript_31722/g.72806  ORF Transcript_31722/g.72806 Transcript_31722/m.72806 type:complete len:105 (-) Transcript_31722:513-827(-)
MRDPVTDPGRRGVRVQPPLVGACKGVLIDDLAGLKSRGGHPKAQGHAANTCKKLQEWDGGARGRCSCRRRTRVHVLRPQVREVRRRVGGRLVADLRAGPSRYMP